MARNCEQDCLDYSFRAVEPQASAGIKAVCTRLIAMGIPAGKGDDVQIALAEAINNVVEHAYAGIPPSDVHIACRLCGNKLEIAISDSGNPMPETGLPSGIPASIETPRHSLPEGGFGWFLIRQLTDEIRYERRGGHNRLYLKFDLTDLS